MGQNRSTHRAPEVRRKLQGLLVSALLVTALAALAGCGSGGGGANGAGSSAGAAKAQAGVMSAAEAKAFLAANPGALILDVREPREFNDDLGHIEGAKLIPSGELGSRVGEIAEYKDKPVLVVCRVGMRSHYSAKFLAEQGFTQASNLNGGMDAWRKAGY